jgi:hypothetical protein
MQRTSARLIPTALTALVLAACGGSGSGSGDQTRVKDTLHRVFAGVANGDGATVCSLATPAGQSRLKSALPGSSCPQVIKLVSQHLSAQVKQGLRSAQITRVAINGNTATVRDTDIRTSQGTLSGFLQPGAAPTVLTRGQDGSWKISG